MLKFFAQNSDGLAVGLVVSNILIMLTMALKADIVYPGIATMMLAAVAVLFKPIDPNRPSNRRIR